MRKSILIYCLILLSINAYSQNINTQGKEFWFGFMENLSLAINDNPDFRLIISSKSKTTGKINIPQLNFEINFEVEANLPKEIFLPTAIYYSSGEEIKGNKGIQIISDDSIEVKALHYRLYFTESSSILPLNAIGYDYKILAEKDFTVRFRQSPSQLLIVSTEDNTQIQITPSVITSSLRNANRPFAIALNKGETFQLQSFEDLSGTLVSSLNLKKIAVFSGARQASTNGACLADNHLYDQNYPINRWGQLYCYIPSKTKVVIY